MYRVKLHHDRAFTSTKRLKSDNEDIGTSIDYGHAKQACMR